MRPLLDASAPAAPLDPASASALVASLVAQRDELLARVRALQADLERPRSVQSALGALLSFNAPSAEVGRLNAEVEVLQQELALKIRENEAIHMELFEKNQQMKVIEIDLQSEKKKSERIAVERDALLESQAQGAGHAKRLTMDLDRAEKKMANMAASHSQALREMGGLVRQATRTNDVNQLGNQGSQTKPGTLWLLLGDLCNTFSTWHRALSVSGGGDKSDVKVAWEALELLRKEASEHLVQSQPPDWSFVENCLGSLSKSLARTTWSTSHVEVKASLDNIARLFRVPESLRSLAAAFNRHSAATAAAAQHADIFASDVSLHLLGIANALESSMPSELLSPQHQQTCVDVERIDCAVSTPEAPEVTIPFAVAPAPMMVFPTTAPPTASSTLSLSKETVSFPAVSTPSSIAVGDLLHLEEFSDSSDSSLRGALRQVKRHYHQESLVLLAREASALSELAQAHARLEDAQARIDHLCEERARHVKVLQGCKAAMKEAREELEATREGMGRQLRELTENIVRLDSELIECRSRLETALEENKRLKREKFGQTVVV